MPANFTNVRVLRERVETSRSRLRAPYMAGAAGPEYSPREREFIRQARVLTPKEKEARRIFRDRTAAFDIEANVGYQMGPNVGANTVLSGNSNFFSVQMGPDFLEMPQSAREMREIRRHFYKNDPIVGQAVDLHTELPLSKVRLSAPKPRLCPEGFESPHDYGAYIHEFFKKMCTRIKLFQRLVTMVHELWVQGNAFIFAEDSSVQVPAEIGYEARVSNEDVVTEDGSAIEAGQTYWVERSDREELELKYYQRHYKGWERMVVLPIDQIRTQTYSFTDRVRVELIPSEKDRALIEQARIGVDPVAVEMAREIPDEIREYIEQGRLIPLGTDPDEGSFVYHLAGRRGAKDELGQSILDRCMRTLYLKEKLRQAQTMIASRAMTPRRVVWAEDISDADAEALREQVDLSLQDPDYSVIANFEVHWEEQSSRDRLLDLQSEYEQADKHLMTGLGVTESLMSGESLYSGDRLKLEVINTRYLFLREILQEYVEEYLFKPVARRKGFVEKDKWGDEQVLYPRLSFTRMPLRDSQDTFDAMYNLYLKGSLPIQYLLEMFNIDPVEAQEGLEKDFFTSNDALFNEMFRGLYNDVANKLVERTDIVERLAKYLKLKLQPQPQEGDVPRF